MKTYTHIEDYLEVLSGKRNIDGSQTSTYLFMTSFSPIVNLARYDVGFLDNVTDTTMQGSALTDRQAELATKLILKYRRQLQAKGIDVEPVSVPRYRKPLRNIDRSKEAWLDDETIRLKFPYNTSLIESIREIGKASQGRIRFNKEQKNWCLALTEFNVNWAIAFAKSHEFTIDPQLENLMQAIIECESRGYAIQLIHAKDGYAIQNATDSLNEYIEQHGGFGKDNLPWLADSAPVLGYTISDAVMLEVEEQFGASTTLLMRSKDYEFGDSAVPERVIQYAQVTNRWPIVVFNPSPQDTFNEWAEHFSDDQVQVIKSPKHEAQITKDTKLVYTNRALYKHLEHLPLLVSHVGMLIGSDKQAMLNITDKIFYAGLKLGGK
jgi:hypothetical protein